ASLGIAGNNAGTINRSAYPVASMSVGDKQLGAALRFFVWVFESLSNVDLAFFGQVRSISCAVRRADVMTSPRRSGLDEWQDVLSRADVRSKNFFAIFFGKRQRCRAMPDLVNDARFTIDAIVQSKFGLRNVPFQNVETVRHRLQRFVGS